MKFAKTLRLLLSASLFLTATLALAETPAAIIRIDPAITHDVWEGWGTSLCWWANVFGDRDDLADLLFTTKTVRLAGKNLPGLGMNIARYNLGACSPSVIAGRRMVVSKTIQPFRQMEGFWLDGKNPDPQSASWDWSRDARQRAMLAKAHARGADRLELFSNAPMWWMCANDNPSGAAKSTDDNLRPENYSLFATYLATAARQARDQWKIAFTTISPFNEPNSRWWDADCKQEGCHFSKAAQAAFLPILRAELDRQGLQHLPITASDESYYDEALGTWKSFSPEIKALIPQINVHGYQKGGGQRAELHRLVAEEDGKRLWNSEHGDGDASGLEMARNFHHDMTDLHPLAWSYWQPFDFKGWGLLAADMKHAKITRVNPKYYVFAQYSRHLRPGMTILETGDPHTVAGYSASERKLVLILLNEGPARKITCDLTGFTIPDGPILQIVTEPKAKARYEKRPGLQIQDRHFTTECAPDSIQTLEISNVTAVN